MQIGDAPNFRARARGAAIARTHEPTALISLDERRAAACQRRAAALGMFDDGEERILPDYGLEVVGGDEGDAAFDDDDTFGGGGTWEQGNEAALDMAQLHEEFLQGDAFGDLTDAGGGMGFFGDDLGQFDFTLEDEPPMGEDAPPSALDDEISLSLDAQTQQLLDDSSPAPFGAAPAPLKAGAGNKGLRVTGLPPTLDELQTKQLLTHFGALSFFELRRGETSGTALLSYGDDTVTETAAASLHGIPLTAGR